MSRNRNTSTTRQKRKVRNTQKKVHHQHKDRLFRFIFQDKEDLLDLYNAVNGTEYDNPDELEITTLDDVIYLSMKNDLSFMLRITLNLYEHQSTWNENMPLRGFFYFAELYDKYIKEQGIKISETIRQVKLPFPKYVVFYNGTRDMPDRVELKLSDCFEKPEREDGEPCLECKALILNINAGRNRELMRKCHRLAEYAYFIGEIRRYMSDGWSLEEATDFSIQKCLRKEVLSDILEKSAMEVRRMILTEYDEIAAREYLKKESMEAGREEGREIGREEGREIGREEGREIGREEGREIGREEGRKIGREEGREIGREEGREIGREEGGELKLLAMIQKKVHKGKNLTEIAEELEESEESIRELYELVQNYPEEEIERMWKILEEKHG